MVASTHTGTPMSSVILPWIDPRAIDICELEGRCVNLAVGFYNYLLSKTVLNEYLARYRRNFRELDVKKELSPDELRRLYNSARMLGLLQFLIDGNGSSVDEDIIDEYIYRLSATSDAWCFRLHRAVPYDSAGKRSFVEPDNESLPRCFNEYLENADPLKDLPNDNMINIIYSELGQLPFVACFLNYIRQVRPKSRPKISNRCIANPDSLHIFSEELKKMGLAIDDKPAFGEKAFADLQHIKTLNHKRWKRALLVNWRADPMRVLNGSSNTGLRKYIKHLSSIGVQIALNACISLSHDKPDSESALFAILDEILAVQWEIKHLDINVLSCSGIGRMHFEKWFESYRHNNLIRDMIKTQLNAEIDNTALSPNNIRTEGIFDGDVKLQAVPRCEVQSHYPLDFLSQLEPAVFCWPAMYGRGIDKPKRSIRVSKKKSSFYVGVGSQLVFAESKVTELLGYFAQPQNARKFLHDKGESLGITQSDIEALIQVKSLSVLHRNTSRDKPKYHSRGQIHYVGIGPGKPNAPDEHCLGAIGNADEIWIQDLGLPSFERTSIRRQLNGKRVINTAHYYGIGRLQRFHRHSFYELVGRRLIHLARAGRRIVSVWSGSPVIWVAQYGIIKEYLNLYDDFDLAITNSMSFLDIMLEPLGSMCEAQIRIGSVSRPDVSPEIDCILGQPGDTGEPHGLRQSIDKLRIDLKRIYPQNHPVFVIGNDEIDEEPLYIKTTIQRLGTVLCEYGRWHISIVIPSLSRARRMRTGRKIEAHRKKLSYLAEQKGPESVCPQGQMAKQV
jgi:hypothetical protein